MAVHVREQELLQNDGESYDCASDGRNNQKHTHGVSADCCDQLDNNASVLPRSAKSWRGRRSAVRP